MSTEFDIPEITSADKPAAEVITHAGGGSVAVPVRRRLRWFKYADRCFNRLAKLIAALHEGFWLGCLSAEDLNALTASHYEQTHEYSSAEHNQRGLFDWETAALKRYFPPGSRILVAAAGGGREVLALRRMGYAAEGFECSPWLLQASEALFDRLGEPRGVTLCPPNEVPAGPADYTGIIVGWSAYTHIPTRRRRIAFLQGLRQRALPGAPILLSFFARDRDPGYENVVYRVSRAARFLFRGRKEESEPGDHLSWCFHHTFTREEVESELKAAAFRPQHYSEVGEGHAVGMAEPEIS
jgi:hypothetical protein